jgi:hypothetical protein
MKVHQMLDKRRQYTPHTVGVEVECMYRGELDFGLAHWDKVGDGSLRGDGIEFVLSRPTDRADLAPKLDELYDAIGEIDVYDGERTGIHVHINVLEMEMKHVFNFITLYHLLERPLVSLSGPHREGNLFCLRGCDAEDIYRRVAMSMRGKYDLFDSIMTDEVRYYSLNLKALCEKGTLEFRSMNSPCDRDKLEEWIDILLELKEAAKTFDSPSEIVGSFSQLDLVPFVKKVSPLLYKAVDVSSYIKSVIEDMRNVQEYAFSKISRDFLEGGVDNEDEEDYNQVPPAEQPRDRDIRVEGVKWDIDKVNINKPIVWEEEEADEEEEDEEDYDED